LQTTREHGAEFFGGLSAVRVIIEVGTHSAWVREVVVGCGHEVLVANPRLMDGAKRGKRKNDRIDCGSRKLGSVW
jgi:transposase